MNNPQNQAPEPAPTPKPMNTRPPAQPGPTFAKVEAAALYDCVVRLHGEIFSQVPKNNVYAAEIIMYRQLHGDDAVIDIYSAGTDEIEPEELREFLYHEFGKDAVDKVFGSTFDARYPVALPRSFGEIGPEANRPSLRYVSNNNKVLTARERRNERTGAVLTKAEKANAA